MSGKEDLEKLPPKRLIHDFIIIMTENIIKCMHTITITELRLTVYMWTIAVRYIVYVAAYGHRCVWVNMYTVRYSLLWVMTYNLKTQLHTNQFEPSAKTMYDWSHSFDSFHYSISHWNTWVRTTYVAAYRVPMKWELY